MSENSSSSITRRLTGASYSLVISGGKRRLWGLAAVTLICAVLAFFWLPNGESTEMSLRTSLAALEGENQRLAQELVQQGLKLQHEISTRQALEGQLAVQTEELKKVRKDLSFYRGNTVR